MYQVALVAGRGFPIPLPEPHIWKLCLPCCSSLNPLLPSCSASPVSTWKRAAPELGSWKLFLLLPCPPSPMQISSFSSWQLCLHHTLGKGGIAGGSGVVTALPLQYGSLLLSCSMGTAQAKPCSSTGQNQWLLRHILLTSAVVLCAALGFTFYKEHGEVTDGPEAGDKNDKRQMASHTRRS